MYLETILILSQKKTNVRSIDVAAYTGYSKPSVSRAVGILKNGGMIELDRSGYIKLTQSGEELAKRIYERHNILAQALQKIGVSEKTAQEDACRIEHYISSESFECIKRYFTAGK